MTISQKDEGKRIKDEENCRVRGERRKDVIVFVLKGVGDGTCS